MTVPPTTSATAIRSTGVQIVETFSDDLAQGRVVGSRGSGGVIRGGRDVERQIGIDHGVLRFRPLIQPGWGREGIAYGPFPRQAGLTFAVSITNGHNTSQGSMIPEHFLRRVARWATGPDAEPLIARGFGWLGAPRKRQTFRRILWWARTWRKTYRLPEFNENLALGWFTEEAPADPVGDGCSLVMHAALGENGELWARVAGRPLEAFRQIKNLRVYYLVTLRERGAVYYAAAIEGARGLGAFPAMRPVAIDAFNDDQALYAGIHQCALGQIGWRVDTLIHGVHIETLPEFAPRFGTAHVGDGLIGDGPLDGDIAGTRWAAGGGAVGLSPNGAVARSRDESALAVADPGAPSGLVHMLVEPAAEAEVGIAWRLRDPRNFWLLKLAATGCTLVRVEDGTETAVASDPEQCLRSGATHSVQILDAHGQIGCYLDGARLFGAWFDDPWQENATGLGPWFGPSDRGTRIRDFEAHPREVPMPAAIDFLPPWHRLGERIVASDDFDAPEGDLAGRKPDSGGGTWEKSAGRGVFDLTGAGSVRVRGSVETPHPNRSFYTLPWSNPGFADLEVTVTPPGADRGEGHRARAGLVFWQDSGNYLSLTTWLQDDYDGASISVFPKRRGFEELYDAVWTMVWHDVHWGRPFRLRCAFDGSNFTIYVNDEPIHQRALADLYPDDPPMRIARVGLAANWEWGCDTGSTFQAFRARL